MSLVCRVEMSGAELLGAEAQAPPSSRDPIAGLAERVVRGEAQAMRPFVSAILPVLARVVRRVLGPTHAELEDVTYEAAYATLRQLPEFRGDSSVRHFIARIGVLTAMNVRRRDAAQKRPRGNSQVDPESLSSEQWGPEADAVSASLVPIVRDLIGTLSEPLAEALTLHVVMGYTVGEIAALGGISVETIRSRLRLAKAALRERALKNPALREALEVEA